MISLVLAAAISWPVRYNDGVIAYHSNDFSSAATTFEQATASPDQALQQRALYNLGNAAYRLGEADPTKAQPLWERAIKSYETALALDPKDEDAKFNHEFVKKKLEELKKQQEQQKQQEKQQNQKNQDQQKKDQGKDQDKNQGQDKDKNQEQQSQQDQQQKQQQPKPEDQKQDQPKPEPSQPKQEPQEQQAQASQAGNLDRQQAKALLDNLREDERNWNFFPEVQMKDLKDAGEPAKDW